MKSYFTEADVIKNIQVVNELTAMGEKELAQNIEQTLLDDQAAWEVMQRVGRKLLRQRTRCEPGESPGVAGDLEALGRRMIQKQRRMQ